MVLSATCTIFTAEFSETAQNSIYIVMRHLLHIFSIVLLAGLFLNGMSLSEHRLASYDNYISQYKNLAIQHQKKYHIPASITLAQGLLESGAGLSTLARQSNNHFGIKCHSDWTGGRVYHDDDLANECFRQYEKVEDSYEDHSHFLADRPRYAGLFALDVTDYIGWAQGLQKCGYATDKAYANKLIKVIEDYELYQYDTASPGKVKESKNNKKINNKNLLKPTKYDIYRTEGLIYVYAGYNDSFDHIAESLGFKSKDLQKYNEVPENFPLREGDIVYLEKKKKKADKPHYEHVVQIGESMHSISQTYGIRIKNLYKMNHKPAEYIPMEGDVLKLR